MMWFRNALLGFCTLGSAGGVALATRLWTWSLNEAPDQRLQTSTGLVAMLASFVWCITFWF